MDGHPLSDVGIDMSEGFSGISHLEVICPSAHLPIDLFNQHGQGNKASLGSCHRFELCPLAFECLV